MVPSPPIQLDVKPREPGRKVENSIVFPFEANFVRKLLGPEKSAKIGFFKTNFGSLTSPLTNIPPWESKVRDSARVTKGPPKNVEYDRCLLEGSKMASSAVELPVLGVISVWMGFTSGKSFAVAKPAMINAPSEERQRTLVRTSDPLPPIKLENIREPEGDICVMKPSSPPACTLWNAFTAGKSLLLVLPTKKALPAASMSTARSESLLEPPR